MEGTPSYDDEFTPGNSLALPNFSEVVDRVAVQMSEFSRDGPDRLEK